MLGVQPRAAVLVDDGDDRRSVRQIGAPPLNDNALATVQRWRAMLDVQMHFDDMLMRTRTTAGSIIVGVFGAAAVSIAEYPQRLIQLPGRTVHIAAVIVAAGLMSLAAVFLLDYFYYFRMLLASVEQTQALEQESRRPGAPIELELSSCLARAVPRRRAAAVVWAFYGIPFVLGLCFLFYIVAWHQAA